MDLTSGQVDFIREWNRRLSKPISIRLYQIADERTGLFEKFGGMLSQLASKVGFITENGEGTEIPALLPGNAWRYHLVPAGAELKPFFELAAMIAQDSGELPEFDTASLKAVQLPSRIKIYLTNYCPHCRDVVTRIMPLPLFNIFPGFLETLMHPDFQTRLGAMVVFEDIAERSPALARTALDPIWQKLDAVDESVRGDMLYLFGLTGDAGWFSRLEAYRSAELTEELRGVVEEAIDNLQSKK
ncbi:MAG: hypothetical protein P1P89_10300 [Desulfobacterales bacterium]|nr:hypothetical protein [Desulfobacterales bacterium]